MRAKYGNGVYITWQYDEATNTLREMKAENADGIISHLEYEYTDTALLANINDMMDPGYSEAFVYDASNRITQATGPYGTKAAPQKAYAYKYKNDGQILFNGESSATGTYVNKIHQMTNQFDTSTGYQMNYQYNERGLMKKKTRGTASWDISYNFNNRPAEIKAKDERGRYSETKFTYNESGQRFKKHYSGEGTTIKTYYIDPEYQIRVNVDNEVHTLAVEKADGTLGTFSFEKKYLLAANIPAELHLARAIAITGFTAYGMQQRTHHLALYLKESGHGRRMAMAFAAILALLILSLVHKPAARHLFYKLGESVRVSARASLAAFELYSSRAIHLAALPTAVIFILNIVSCMAIDGPLDPYVVPLDPQGDLKPHIGDFTGNHFFISNHLRSNYLVTNAAGKVITRYVYTPYGRINMELSNDDVDGDGKKFNILQRYTGQEYDYETGFYNYNARLYDPESGRFLQTDPKHKEMAGWSNYDRYSYVHANPIMLIDPSGEVAWSIFQMAAAAELHTPGSVQSTFDRWRVQINKGFTDLSKRISKLVNNFYNQLSDRKNEMIKIVDDFIENPIGTLLNAFIGNPFLFTHAKYNNEIVKGLFKNLDQGARRQGEAGEEERGTRHPNLRWRTYLTGPTDVLTIPGILGIGTKSSATFYYGWKWGAQFSEWIGVTDPIIVGSKAGAGAVGWWISVGLIAADISYNIFLDSNGMRPHKPNLFGTFFFRAVVSEQTGDTPIQLCAALPKSCSGGDHRFDK